MKTLLHSGTSGENIAHIDLILVEAIEAVIMVVVSVLYVVIFITELYKVLSLLSLMFYIFQEENLLHASTAQVHEQVSDQPKRRHEMS